MKHSVSKDVDSLLEDSTGVRLCPQTLVNLFTPRHMNTTNPQAWNYSTYFWWITRTYNPSSRGSNTHTLSKKKSPLKMFSCLFLCLWVVCLHTNLYTMPFGARRRCLIRGSLNYRMREQPEVVLGIKPMSCGRAASTLNYWTISSASPLSFKSKLLSIILGIVTNDLRITLRDVIISGLDSSR